jgi:four helix bundle protein
MSLFDHEKLSVYQLGIEFVAWSDDVQTRVLENAAVQKQMERAATSIPLNIAEGNGRHTPADRCRFLDNARGSALECAACLDVMVAKKMVEPQSVTEGKVLLSRIVSMLIGLIRSISLERDV